MILIIEVDASVREDLVRTIRWTDRRHRIEVCDNVWDGLRLSSKLRPDLVFISTKLGAAGLELAQNIRTTLRGAMIFGAGSKIPEAESVFDAVIENTSDHVRIGGLITHQRRRTQQLSSETWPRLRKKRSRPKSADPRLNVTVRLKDNDNPRFRIEVMQGTTLGKLLDQLSKYSVQWYSLYRNGNEQNVNLETLLQQGDELLLLAERPQPRQSSIISNA